MLFSRWNMLEPPQKRKKGNPDHLLIHPGMWLESEIHQDWMPEDEWALLNQGLKLTFLVVLIYVARYLYPKVHKGSQWAGCFCFPTLWTICHRLPMGSNVDIPDTLISPHRGFEQCLFRVKVPSSQSGMSMPATCQRSKPMLRPYLVNIHWCLLHIPEKYKLFCWEVARSLLKFCVVRTWKKSAQQVACTVHKPMHHLI